jgi:hypothetical protein
MKVTAYLIRTRHGSGQSPQVVERVTFDVRVAKRARDLGSEIEALVTLSEAHRQLAKAVEQTRREAERERR